MLQLLTPEQIENEKKTTANEIQERVWGLAGEESRLVTSVNSLRAEETGIQRRIEYLKSVDEGTLSTRKGILLGEVEALERRRSVALQPIADVMAEAQLYLNQNKEKAIGLEREENRLKSLSDDLRERVEDLADGEQDLIDSKIRQKEDFARRETVLSAAEAEIKSQTTRLASEWVDYHTAISVANEQMTAREKAVSEGERVNLIVRESLAERENMLNERERGITDKYNSLLAATEEFEKNHGNHGKKRS